jgi:hypothetical protein
MLPVKNDIIYVTMFLSSKKINNLLIIYTTNTKDIILGPIIVLYNMSNIIPEMVAKIMQSWTEYTMAKPIRVIIIIFGA